MWGEGLLHDLRLAVRSLRAAPLVSLAAVVSLALGMGANTAIFSLLNGLLLRPLPVHDPYRLATISSDQAIGLGFRSGPGWNYPMWEQFRRLENGFAGAAVYTSVRLDLSQGGESQPVTALVVSGDYFTMLGVHAQIGRTLTAADDVTGGGPDGPVAVISHGLWQQRYNGAPDVIGKALHLDGAPFTIVGVAPPGFFGLHVGRSFDVAVPLLTDPLIRGSQSVVQLHQAYMLIAVVRMRPEQSLASSTQALRALQPDILPKSRYPKFLQDPFTLSPAGTGTSSGNAGYERTLAALFVIVGLVLLIACANIANLLLARSVARQQELTIRLALGASRARLARQLMIESVVLAAAGAAAGLVFAMWATRGIVGQLSRPGTDLTLNLSLDWRVLAFTAGIAMATALLFGTAPAWRACRFEPMAVLKGFGRGSSRESRPAVSGLLVAGQIAISVVLLVAAGLFIRTFDSLARVPLGFDSDRVLVAQVQTSRAAVDTSNRLDFFQGMASTLAALPEVASAAASISTPASGGLLQSVKVPDGPPGEEHLVLVNAVTSGWFAAYGTAFRAGRDFGDADTAASPRVAIVNETLARRAYPRREALGASIDGRTIVGIVGDQVVQGGFKRDGSPRTRRDGVAPALYIPLSQSAGAGPPGRSAVVLSIRPRTGTPASVAGNVSDALRRLDDRLTFTFHSLSDSVSAPMVQDRLIALLSGFFGVLALILATLGLYGVTAHTVSRRRQEVGIRLALGSSPAEIVRLVLRRVGLPIGLGIAAGTAACLWLSRFAAPLVYGLPPRDPSTLAGAAAVLAVAAGAAAWVPAHRVSRTDPAAVLRD